MVGMNGFFEGFKDGMKSFGENIAIIINTVLLFLVYVLGVGITSIIAKIMGKRFLHTKISKRRDSYWAKLDLKKRSKEEYYRQF
jgi:hypothetical protein